MSEKPELYFPRDIEWREWLEQNHKLYPDGVYLIFYKLETKIPTMRWEEAVRVALCFGWIDSTVQSLGQGKRRQYFCKRNPKSNWSALNKKHIVELENDGLIHKTGYESISIAKENGSWSAMDDVENLVIPPDLQQAFKANREAYENYKNFAPGYRKSYLSWLFQAKRPATRERRLQEIIKLCAENKRSRQ